VTRLAGALSVESAVAVLAAMPAAELAGLGRALYLLWRRAEKSTPELRERVAELIAAARAPEPLKVLGDQLLEGKLDGYRGQTLYALCSALIDRDMGRSHVLELATRRAAGEQSRLIAIDCLRHDSTLAREMCRFRLTHVFESAAVRDRIKQLAGAIKPKAEST
jgi:hypothetical protein